MAYRVQFECQVNELEFGGIQSIKKEIIRDHVFATMKGAKLWSKLAWSNIIQEKNLTHVYSGSTWCLLMECLDECLDNIFHSLNHSLSYFQPITTSITSLPWHITPWDLRFKTKEENGYRDFNNHEMNLFNAGLINAYEINYNIQFHYEP